ncbi:A-kinase anchor protein 7 isoform X1 [Polypterus senegalus]|uniref:A-kinase anchor protein 7 isoform X1 n=1 Tax=Polypterus senegalus TaxID=55291 RepID=UPI00196263FF|nr:A-kinase anchor protein 7 isoform X1 [Polypterus senegalus]
MLPTGRVVVSFFSHLKNFAATWSSGERRLGAKSGRQLQRLYSTVTSEPAALCFMSEKCPCANPKGQENTTSQGPDSSKDAMGSSATRSLPSAKAAQLTVTVAQTCEDIPADLAIELGSHDLPTTAVRTRENEKLTKKSKKKKMLKKQMREDAIQTEEHSSNYLTELPFANIEIMKEFDIKISERRQKKKRKRTLGDETEDDSDKKKKKKHLHPNYFISVPITNQKIHASIKAIQTLIIEEDDRYTKAMIPLSTLHMTLLVTYLRSEEEVNIAISVIKGVKESIQRILQGETLILPFHGIGHFRNEVVFVKMVEAEDFLKLKKITEVLRRAFEEKGILAGDSKDFKPHLTFMKLSRAPKLRSQGIKKLDPKLYKNFENQNFGNEKLVNLDLCSMLKKKQPNGYYHCEASITVGENNVVEPDDAELVSLSKRLVENAVLKAVQQYLEETQQSKGRQSNSGPAKTEESLNGSENRK